MIRALLRPALATAALALAACSAAPAVPARASSSADAPAASETPGQACLRTASAPREKRAGEPARIGAKHVLVKYDGAKGAKAPASRTREAACMRAIEARDKLRGGADFGEIVAAYSEEPGAASRAGSLGQVERSALVPAFADAAFELDIGQLSDVVETDFGFHIIARTE